MNENTENTPKKTLDKSQAIQIESILNKKDGSLPFGYYAPSEEGRVTWNCGYDKEGKIISIFCCDMGTHKDKRPAILPDLKAAIYAKEQLIANGWKPLEPPKITTTRDDGSEKPLNRKEKRYLSKQLASQIKNDPFSEKK